MIPTSLSVRNFMCYRAGVDLDLRGIRVACLSGDNGAGKSALLDCITWALWGKARVNSDRELIALNATEMEVTFGFELNDQDYRVTRRRTRSGAGPLSLDIQILDGELWRTIGGATARETQRTIDQLLKMDYDTFINSAFILQGRADEFTTKTPALRKQTLGEILNLSDYDRFEELARQQLRDRERLIRQIDADIERFDARLAELPARRDDVGKLSQQLIDIADEVDQMTERASKVHERLRGLEAAARQRDDIRQEMTSLDREIAKLGDEVTRTSARIEKHRAVLARREEIEGRHRELVELRREQEQVGMALAQRQSLLQERRTVELAIQQALHSIQSQLQSVRDRIEGLSRTASARTQIEAEQANLRAEIAGLGDPMQKLELLRVAQSALETRRGELSAENEQLKKEMNVLKGKIDQLDQATAVCPVCQQELGPEERKRLGEEYKIEGTALGNRFRENRTSIVRIDADIHQNKQESQEVERLRQRLEQLARSEASLNERLAVAMRAEAEVAEFRAREAELSAKLRGKLDRARGAPQAAGDRPASGGDPI